jgi:hypothetical protein
MLCAEGARDANDAMCLLRIDTPMDANLSARVLHAALKSIIPGLSWVARVARNAGRTTIIASHFPEGELCSSALTDFVPGHGLEFVALAGGSHTTISDGALGFTISTDPTNAAPLSTTIHLRRALMWAPRLSAEVPPRAAAAPAAGRGARSAWGSLSAPSLITEATGPLVCAAAQATAAILGMNPPPTASARAMAAAGQAAADVAAAHHTQSEAAADAADGITAARGRRKQQQVPKAPATGAAALMVAAAAAEASRAEQAAILGPIAEKRRVDSAAAKAAGEAIQQAAAEEAAAVEEWAAAAQRAADAEQAAVAERAADAERAVVVAAMVATMFAKVAAPRGSKRPAPQRDESPDSRGAGLGAHEAMEDVEAGDAPAEDADMEDVPSGPPHTASALPPPPPPPHGSVEDPLPHA